MFEGRIITNFTVWCVENESLQYPKLKFFRFAEVVL